MKTKILIGYMLALFAGIVSADEMLTCDFKLTGGMLKEYTEPFKDVCSDKRECTLYWHFMTGGKVMYFNVANTENISIELAAGQDRLVHISASIGKNPGLAYVLHRAVGGLWSLVITPVGSKPITVYPLCRSYPIVRAQFKVLPAARVTSVPYDYLTNIALPSYDLPQDEQPMSPPPPEYPHREQGEGKHG